MATEYIMTIDEGTTSARAVFVNHDCEIVSIAQKEFTQFYPNPGWVEQDPVEIWQTTVEVISKAMTDGNIKPEQIKAIGITNQRETCVVWNKNTGKPVYNDINWADRRTADWMEKEVRAKGKAQMIREKTAMPADSWYSASKVKWILDNVEGARASAEKGELLWGTIDTWILWNLSGHKSHMTDYGNASHTLLENVYEMKWDDELLELFTIPKDMCPTLGESSGDFGVTDVPELFGDHKIPITGIAGDQMAAAFGQCCYEKGQSKMTWGTAGVFCMNAGDKPLVSEHGLTSTLGWTIKGKTTFLLEGTVFQAGDTLKWLRDEMDMVDITPDTEYFAPRAALPLGTVYLIPSFSGVGLPWEGPFARAAIFGMSRGCTKYDIIRAACDSLVYQTADIVDAANQDTNSKLELLRIDGGAANNGLIAQFCADILGINVERPENVETTAMGAAYLAGLAVGYWKDEQEILKNRKVEHVFHSKMDAAERDKLHKGWINCVKTVIDWSEKDKAIKES